MALKIYNTLGREKQPFMPVNEGRVGMYFCGMTVQDRPHVGHMRAFITGDIIRRYLEYKGFEVIYLTNFTDIDDKIIARAHREDTDWRMIADRYINEYFQVADAMNIKRATHYPRATIHVQEIIEMIQAILQNGHGYVTSNGSVYFHVPSFPEYGKLSGKKLEDLIAGARVEPDPEKKHPADFALWKAWKEGEPYWYSPWGIGRPGWHIECSAMTTHYLGQPFDIHGGGTDLIFPHHENEIAQAEAAYGKKFVNYWVHNGPVRLKGEKMSKSTGLYFAVLDVLQDYNPNELRLYLLKTHYRTPIDYSFERLNEAKSAWQNFSSFFGQLNELPEPDMSNPEVARWVKEFEKAMDDDFNTPKALAVAFELLAEARKKLNQGDKSASELAAALLIILKVLGFKAEKGAKKMEGIVDDLIQLLVEVRSELRKERNFALADKIRDRLGSLGVLLEDTPQGTRYRIV